MRKFFTISALLLLSVSGLATDKKGMEKAAANVSSGNLYEYGQFPTKLIQPRNVYVWVPDGYTENRKYDVIYMHDGQMLFDSTSTWNKQEWQVDEKVSELLKDGKIKDCIIVGVWNIPQNRFYDYFPQKVIQFMPENEYQEFDKEQHADRLDADNYLRFLVNELKPYIDSHYSTYTDREHTFLMGSSMGGLISLYGLCEYPQVFGGAACLSMHSLMITSGMMNERNIEISAPAFCRYLKANLPKANSARIYIDFGDKTLDAYYAPYQNKIDDVMRSQGWCRPAWTTNFYPGMAHSETDWAKRLFVPMMFLIGK